MWKPKYLEKKWDLTFLLILILTKDRKGKINRQQAYDKEGKEIRVNSSLAKLTDSNTSPQVGA